MLIRHLLVALPIAATLLAGPSFAQTIVVSGHAPTFAALEYDYSDTAGTTPARNEIAAVIPVGSSVDGARATLRHAGAVCRDRSAARMTCAWTAFGTDRDQLLDITWTVEVNHNADAVTGLGVARSLTGA